MDNAVITVPEAVDDAGGLNRAEVADGFDDSRARGGKTVVVDFVKIVTIGFPIFVKDQTEIKARKSIEPGGVGLDFWGLAGTVVTVEVNALSVFAVFELQPGRIHAWAENKTRVRRPLVFFDETAERHRAGGFVAVDARRNVNGSRRIFQGAAITVELIAVNGAEAFGLPMASESGGVEFAEILRDIQPFTVVTAFV
jgi:hypothetical protein